MTYDVTKYQDIWICLDSCSSRTPAFLYFILPQADFPRCFTSPPVGREYYLRTSAPHQVDVTAEPTSIRIKHLLIVEDASWTSKKQHGRRHVKVIAGTA